jgi:hypothetical protein
MGEEENIFSHLHGWENSLIESVKSRACSGVAETTIKVVAFVRLSGFCFRNRAEEMIAPFAKPMASLIVSKKGVGNKNRVGSSAIVLDD